MQTLESLKRKIESSEDLQSVVKTMKTLAAVNIRHLEKAVESLTEYSRTIELGFQVIMRESQEGIMTGRSEQGGRLGAIVFGSEQGMCGDFNEQIALYAINKINGFKVSQENRVIMSMGERVIAILEEEGQSIDEQFLISGSYGGITPMLQEVLMKIEEYRLHKGIEKILLFYNRPVAGASYQPCMVQLFPVDINWLETLGKKKWPTHVLPTFTMDWRYLFSSLLQQYFFVSLYRAFAESLASENASRVASMRAAEKNIEDHLEELNGEFHHQRQETITAELLDIISGFEALSH